MQKLSYYFCVTIPSSSSKQEIWVRVPGLRLEPPFSLRSWSENHHFSLLFQLQNGVLSMDDGKSNPEGRTEGSSNMAVSEFSTLPSEPRANQPEVELPPPYSQVPLSQFPNQRVIHNPVQQQNTWNSQGTNLWYGLTLKTEGYSFVFT